MSESDHRHSPPRNIILVGASTGGTRVLTELISRLPPLRACMVIAQHMPRFINASLEKTLSGISRNELRLARNGDRLRDGLILLAPSELHCSLTSNATIHLAPGEKVNFVCPSVDVLMRSVCKPLPNQGLFGVLLTGMGKDGAEGMLHIKKLGGLTMAQDRASCAVYGMPGEAVKLGCVDAELPPAAIARVLETKLRARQETLA